MSAALHEQKAETAIKDALVSIWRICNSIIILFLKLSCIWPIDSLILSFWMQNITTAWVAVEYPLDMGVLFAEKQSMQTMTDYCVLSEEQRTDKGKQSLLLPVFIQS